MHGIIIIKSEVVLPSHEVIVDGQTTVSASRTGSLTLVAALILGGGVRGPSRDRPTCPCIAIANGVGLGGVAPSGALGLAHATLWDRTMAGVWTGACLVAVTTWAVFVGGTVMHITLLASLGGALTCVLWLWWFTGRLAVPLSEVSLPRNTLRVLDVTVVTAVISAFRLGEDTEALPTEGLPGPIKAGTLRSRRAVLVAYFLRAPATEARLVPNTGSTVFVWVAGIHH
jgi:hypothetical protein